MDFLRLFTPSSSSGFVLAALTAAVAVVVLAFSHRALAGDGRRRWFHALALCLATATTLAALAGDMIVLAVSWVTVTAALVGLLGYAGAWERAREARRRVLASLLVGDTALVAAFIVAASSAGTTDLHRGDEIAASLSSGTGHVVAVLLVIAGLSRSALVPMHRWLPSTLSAPTPVSALLHAGVVNGAGVLVLSTAPIVTASAVAMSLLFAAGALTAVLATAVMLTRSDAKGGLAWSTAGQMGFMAVQLAVGAFGAALFHLLGHAMYKASMFLGAGGAVAAATADRRLATFDRSGSTVAVRLVTGIVAAGSIAAAAAAIRPDEAAAGVALMVVFGWFLAARVASGWMISSGAAGRNAVIGVAAAVALPWAYLGMLDLAKSVIPVPDVANGVVGLAAVIAVIVAVAVLAAVVQWAPGEFGIGLRSRVSGLLFAVSTETPLFARRSASAARVGQNAAAASGRAPHPAPASASATPVAPAIDPALAASATSDRTLSA